MTSEQMLRQADERATTLVYRGNIGDKTLLMKSGLVTVTGVKSGDRSLKLRVQLFNNKKYRTQDVMVYYVKENIIKMTDEVSEV